MKFFLFAITILSWLTPSHAEVVDCTGISTNLPRWVPEITKSATNNLSQPYPNLVQDYLNIVKSTTKEIEVQQKISDKYLCTLASTRMGVYWTFTEKTPESQSLELALRPSQPNTLSFHIYGGPGGWEKLMGTGRGCARLEAKINGVQVKNNNGEIFWGYLKLVTKANGLIIDITAVNTESECTR
jgi:hypothetical protein